MHGLMRGGVEDRDQPHGVQRNMRFLLADIHAGRQIEHRPAGRMADTASRVCRRHGSRGYCAQDDGAAERGNAAALHGLIFGFRSEEHTSELQSLMRISYAVFCLKKTK